MQRLFHLSSRSKGLSFNALRQLYLTCIIPILDYGSVLWYNKYGTAKLTQMCDKIQKQALTTITGAYRSSPSKALEVEAAILPFKVRHFKQASFYSLRLLKFQVHHSLYSSLSSKLQDELDFPSDKTDLSIFALLDNKLSSQLHRVALILKQFSKTKNL